MSTRARQIIKGLIGLIVIYAVSREWSSPAFTDFSVYWDAGKKAILHQTVYDVQGHYQFKYSPLVAWVYGVFFSGLEVTTAGLIHRALSMLVWFLIIRFSLRNLVEANRQTAAMDWLALAFAISLRDELKLGQVNAWVIAFLLLSAALLGTKKRSQVMEALGTLPLAFSILLKPHAAIALVLLFLARRFRSFYFVLIWIFVLGYGVLGLIHGLDFAIAENREWMQSLGQSTEELLGSIHNVSLLGVLIKAGITLSSAWWSVGTLLVLSLVVLAILVRHELSLYAWLWSLGLMAILPPISWSYWNLYLLPIFLVVLNHALRPAKDQVISRKVVWWASVSFFTVSSLWQNESVFHRGVQTLASIVLMVLFAEIALHRPSRRV